MIAGESIVCFSHRDLTTTPRHEDSFLPLSSMAAVPAVKNLASTTLMQRHAVLVEFVYTVVSDVQMKHVSRILRNAFVAPVVTRYTQRADVIEALRDQRFRIAIVFAEDPLYFRVIGHALLPRRVDV